MTFPAQRLPDGNILAPHHLYIGVLAAYIVCWVASNRMPKREAWATVTALTVALFGFLFVWPDYPATGALLTLSGIVGALLAVVFRSFWSDSASDLRLAALFGVLIALDDAVSHSFGVWTPLDWFWHVYLIHLVT
ncbi:hypothetical protein A4G99_09545 [Haladaptatus sp. R4]|uniref:hypothetical protein n=1 Tax=Haladaptatus sp. R4 TaxID=1679489 RepID=UPI0007B4875B|nr:hypothetical protein [Haladaptatus sp. R4]KZN24597.1 hypothetical protein A4G99_09545 [Haladaptatus sp. R4]